MGNFNKILLTGAIAALAGGCMTAAPSAPRQFDLSNYAWKSSRGASMKAFNDKRSMQIDKNNRLMMRHANALEGGITPDVSFNASPKLGDLDGPDGKLWYYTSDYVYKTIHHENYDEQIVLEYTFNIYDENAKLVGTIHDKMRYRENEIRTPKLPELVGFVSKNYFNDDDKYEVVVGLVINCGYTDANGEFVWMPNTYRNEVYSLGGETEKVEVESPEGGMVEKEFSKPVYTLEGQIGDVLDASTGTEERFYLTMYDESIDRDYEDGDIEGGEDGPTVSDEYWEKLCANHITLSIYDKVGADGKMQKLMGYEIPILKLPGDQENTPFVISCGNGKDSYYMIQHYKDYFPNKYTSATEDMSMREHNSLMVSIYRFKDGKLELSNSTEIPFVKDSADRLNFTFMSVGDLLYLGDINFDENGVPSYFVRKKNEFADESTTISYYHYGSDGKKINDIFENADSFLSLSDIEGHDAQTLFVTFENDEYIFHFVNPMTGKENTKFSCYVQTDPDSDPEMLTSNMDRIKIGDTYEYAFEMRNPTLDDYDNTINRFAWFDKDGKFLRIEEVNMGQNVTYARSRILSSDLQPNVFLKDDTREYMIQIKRGIDASSMREEFLIAQPVSDENPTGKDVLLLTPDERGVLSSFLPYTHLDNPMLHIYYYDQATGNMSLDIYNLPFDASKVEEIEAAGSGAALTFDGSTVYADGEIKVYSLQGIAVKSGKDSVSVSDLDGGIYVVVSGKDVRKFTVK